MKSELLMPRRTLLALFYLSIFFTETTFAASTSGEIFGSSNCSRLLEANVTPFEKYESRPDPSTFKGRWRNRALLWWHRNNLVEINDVPVRTQCGGTCYLFASQTMAESALKAQGILDSKGYLITILPLFRIAQQRHQQDPDAVPDFKRVDGGFVQQEGLGSLIGAKSYVLDGETVERLGGFQKADTIERQVLDQILNGESWRFWDRSYNLRRLLAESQATQISTIKEKLEKAYSRAAKQLVRLREIEILDINGVVVQNFPTRDPQFPLTTSNHYLRWEGSFKDFDQNRLVKNGWAKAIPQTYAVEPSETLDLQPLDMAKGVIPELLSVIAGGQVVDVAVTNLFADEIGSHDAHEIALVGAVVMKSSKELKGFKYVNSWSSKFGSAGFGYLSRHQLEGGFSSFTYIKSITVREN